MPIVLLLGMILGLAGLALAQPTLWALGVALVGGVLRVAWRWRAR